MKDSGKRKRDATPSSTTIEYERIWKTLGEGGTYGDDPISLSCAEHVDRLGEAIRNNKSQTTLRLDFGNFVPDALPSLQIPDGLAEFIGTMPRLREMHLLGLDRPGGPRIEKALLLEASRNQALEVLTMSSLDGETQRGLSQVVAFCPLKKVIIQRLRKLDTWTSRTLGDSFRLNTSLTTVQINRTGIRGGKRLDALQTAEYILRGATSVRSYRSWGLGIMRTIAGEHGILLTFFNTTQNHRETVREMDDRWDSLVAELMAEKRKSRLWMSLSGVKSMPSTLVGKVTDFLRRPFMIYSIEARGINSPFLLKQVGESISACVYLRKLSLLDTEDPDSPIADDGNQIESWEHFLNPMADFLAKNHFLQYLVLNVKRVPCEMARAMAEHPSLDHWAFTGTSLFLADVRSIMQAHRSSKTLRELAILFPRLGDGSAIDLLGTWLASDEPRLTRLTLHLLRFDGEERRLVMTIVSSLEERNRSLEALRIGTRGMACGTILRALISSMVKNDVIREVDLSFDGALAPVDPDLVTGLIENRSLTALSLGKLQRTDAGLGRTIEFICERNRFLLCTLGNGGSGVDVGEEVGVTRQLRDSLIPAYLASRNVDWMERSLCYDLLRTRIPPRCR